MSAILYVENKCGHASPFFVSESAVRRALGPHSPVLLKVCAADAPDEAALRSATYFVGSSLDTERLRVVGRSLKLVHCLSSGIEQYLPLDWLKPDTVFTNSRGVHAEKCGAFGAMAVLMLNERMPRHAHAQRGNRWEPTYATSITGKTVLIYGVGAIGAAIAKRIQPFGVNVIGLRRSGASIDGVDAMYAPDALHMLLPRADFLVVCCPLTSATRGSIGARELQLLPPGAGLLNVARSAIVDQAALIAALEEDRLSGAILDVFDTEPLAPESPLWQVPGLTITPHVSADDPIAYVDRSLAILADNIQRLDDGRPLVNIVQGWREY